MAYKRTVSDTKSGGSSSDDSKRTKTCFHDDDEQHAWTLFLQFLLLLLKPLIQKLIGEEIDKRMSTPSRAKQSRESKQAERSYQLHIVEDMKGPYFTKTRFPLQVQVRDVLNNQVVTSGALASMKVSIVALPGDFRGENHDGARHFNSSIIKARNDMPPLLIGGCNVPLHDGVGEAKDLYFTDISKRWRGRFRIGVKAPADLQYLVREAVSGPFQVQDQRSRGNQKHDQPKEKDELWRLKGMGQNGPIYNYLKSINVQNVGGLVRKMRSDPESFHNKALFKDGQWKVIRENALACRPDEMFRFEYTISEGDQNLSLIMDSLYEVVAVCFDGSILEMVGNLDDHQKRFLDCWKKKAYMDTKAFSPIRWPALDSAMDTAIHSSFHGFARDETKGKAPVPYFVGEEPSTSFQRDIGDQCLYDGSLGIWHPQSSWAGQVGTDRSNCTGQFGTGATGGQPSRLEQYNHAYLRNLDLQESCAGQFAGGSDCPVGTSKQLRRNELPNVNQQRRLQKETVQDKTHFHLETIHQASTHLSHPGNWTTAQTINSSNLCVYSPKTLTGFCSTGVAFVSDFPKNEVSFGTGESTSMMKSVDDGGAENGGICDLVGTAERDQFWYLDGRSGRKIFRKMKKIILN